MSNLGIGDSAPTLSESSDQNKLSSLIGEVITPELLGPLGSPPQFIERQPSKRGISRESSKVDFESSEAALNSQASAFRDNNESYGTLSKSKSGVIYDTNHATELISEQKITSQFSRGSSAKFTASEDKPIEISTSSSPPRRAEIGNLSSPKPIAKKNLVVETKSVANQQSSQISPFRRTEVDRLLSPKNVNKK